MFQRHEVMCVPLVHCLCLLSDSFSSVGRPCWCTSRWALNQPSFLAKSQHKCPRTNTEVTWGSPIFQSSFNTSPRLSNNFTPDSFFALSQFLRYFPGPLLPSFILLACSLCFAVDFSSFFKKSFFFPSRPVWIAHSGCLSLLRSVSLTYLFVLCYFNFKRPPFWSFYPIFSSSPPRYMANMSLWHSLNHIPQPSVNICLISHQHTSVSPSPTCLPRPPARLSPATCGSFVMPWCVCRLQDCPYHWSPPGQNFWWWATVANTFPCVYTYINSCCTVNIINFMDSKYTSICVFHCVFWSLHDFNLNVHIGCMH